jgi:hypothetical protein
LNTGRGEDLRCCELEHVKSSIRFDNLNKAAFLSMISKWGFNGYINSEQVRQRYDILFSNPQKKAMFEAYGFMFLMVVDFADEVIDAALPLVEEMYGSLLYNGNHSFLDYVPNLMDTLVIGAHLRHQRTDERLELIYDEHMFTYIREIVNTTRLRSPFQKCYLILSTDRVQSIVRFLSFNSSVGCEVRYGTLNEITIALVANCAIYEVDKGKLENPLRQQEHGPWNGLLAMADLLLISFSR